MAKASQFEADLLESMAEVAAHARGEATGIRQTAFQIPDVKAIREKLAMSQSQFAEAFGIPLANIQAWEQHRRNPDRTASAYLNVIARIPNEARAALQL